MQRQPAVSVYLKSEQLPLFAIALRCCGAREKQTAVTDYLKSKQLPLFAFALRCCEVGDNTVSHSVVQIGPEVAGPRRREKLADKHALGAHHRVRSTGQSSVANTQGKN